MKHVFGEIYERIRDLPQSLRTTGARDNPICTCLYQLQFLSNMAARNACSMPADGCDQTIAASAEMHPSRCACTIPIALCDRTGNVLNVHTCEGFRMPAYLSDGRGTGAGFRKPPGKEPRGIEVVVSELWGFERSSRPDGATAMSAFGEWTDRRNDCH